MTCAILLRTGRYMAAPATATTFFLGQRSSVNASAITTPAVLEQTVAAGHTGVYRQLQRRKFADSAKGANSPEKKAVVVQASNSRKEHAFKTTVKPKSGGFLEWYEKHLASRPVQTKMATGCLLWGIGDVVAQVGPFFTHPPQVKMTDDGTIVKGVPFVFDYARLGRAAFFGFAMHAPLAHVHYNFLESMTVRTGITGIKIPFFKVFMEVRAYGRNALEWCTRGGSFQS